MKRVTGPVEAKTAAATIVPLIAGVVFACAHAYGWFTPPPAYVQAGLITILVGLAGWFAPHTHRPSPLTLTADDFKLVKAVAAWLKGEPPPAAAPQPEGTKP